MTEEASIFHSKWKKYQITYFNKTKFFKDVEAKHFLSDITEQPDIHIRAKKEYFLEHTPIYYNLSAQAHDTDFKTLDLLRDEIVKRIKKDKRLNRYDMFKKNMQAYKLGKYYFGYLIHIDVCDVDVDQNQMKFSLFNLEFIKFLEKQQKEINVCLIVLENINEVIVFENNKKTRKQLLKNNQTYQKDKASAAHVTQAAYTTPNFNINMIKNSKQ